MYTGNTAPWLEFHAYLDVDDSPDDTITSATAGLSLYIQRDNLADGSPMSLSDASGPTDWAAGKIWPMGGNKYRVGIATANISSYDGKISIGGSYDAGWIDGTTEIVSIVNTGDTIRAGLTSLPNANADAAGGLPISDSGGLDLDTLLTYLDATISSRMASYTQPTGFLTTNFPDNVASSGNITNAANVIVASGQGNWLTATGFSTPTDITSARDTVLATGDSDWKTATGFAAPTDIGVYADIIVESGNQYWSTSILTSGDIAEAVNNTLSSSHGLGSWETASGFSTLSDIGSYADLIVESGNQYWVTATGVTINDINTPTLIKFITLDTGETAATTGSVAQIAQGTGAGPIGPGTDNVTITIEDDGSPEAGVSVWITDDEDGNIQIAGELVTDALGQVTFLLTAGATYYLWAQKEGKMSIRGQSFVAAADA